MASGSLFYLIRDNEVVLKCVDDETIHRALTQFGAVKFEATNRLSGAKEAYWRVSQAKFADIKPHIHALGYAPYAPPTPVSPNPSPPQKLSPQADTLTVSAFNQCLALALKASFPASLWLRGEVSEMSIKKGHVFLRLVENQDSAAEVYSLSAVIWRTAWAKIQARIQSGNLPAVENGIEIRVRVEVQCYEKQATVSVSIVEIDEHYAIGEFYRKKEQIEARLAALGLADRNKSLPEPILPLRLAVFSNDTAAGWGDFLKILSDSGYGFEVTLFRVALQGRNVELTFAAAFERLQAMGTGAFDYGVIVRGGGSVVELSAFNNENIALAIARSDLKFIIGIGHDRDRTVLDEIAVRAATPTAAAGYFVEKLEACQRSLNNLQSALEDISAKTLDNGEKLMQRSAMSLMSLSQVRLNAVSQALSETRSQLEFCISRQQQRWHAQLQELVHGIHASRIQLFAQQSHRLSRLSEEVAAGAKLAIACRQAQLSESVRELGRVLSSKQADAARSLDVCEARLSALDPRQQLARGFVILQTEDARAVTSVAELIPGQRLRALLQDGLLDMTVDDIRKKQ